MLIPKGCIGVGWITIIATVGVSSSTEQCRVREIKTIAAAALLGILWSKGTVKSMVVAAAAVTLTRKESKQIVLRKAFWKIHAIHVLEI